jgi:hypothetical protein
MFYRLKTRQVALLIAMLGTGALAWAQDNSPCVAPRPDAPVKVSLRNPSFTAAQDGQAVDWTPLEHRVAGNYVFELDSAQPRSKPYSAVIRQIHPEDYGTLKQTVRVQPCWRGKLARLSGDLRTEGANGGGGALILHATNGSDILAWNHMNDDRVKGTQPWKRYSIVMKIPPAGYELDVAVTLEDDGKLWADDIELEIVEPPAP